MTNDVDIDLIGDDELMRVLQELDYKTQHRFLKRILNNAANIPLREARNAIPIRNTKIEPSGKRWHPPGAGKRSMRKKMGKSRKTATVFVGPRTGTGSYETDAFYLKFWEYYRPGTGAIQNAYERVKRQTEDHLVKSVRTIFERAYAKLRK